MRNILFIAIMLCSLVGFSQTSIFDKYDGNEEVTTVIVNKKMFELMAKFGGSSEEAKEYTNMVGGLIGLKVFTTENPDVALDMRNTVESYKKSSQLSELMRVNDKEAQVIIYIKEGKDDEHVEELLMFVNEIGKTLDGVEGFEAEAVVVSLVGDIDLNKISELTEKMNISGSEHLKSSSKE